MRLFSPFLLLLLVSFPTSNCLIKHVCIHGDIPPSPVFTVPSTLKRDATSYANFRVFLDYSNCQVADPQTCSNPGDVVAIGESSSTISCTESVTTNCLHTCTTGDVLTRDKSALIQTLMSGATAWLHSALQVLPSASNVTLPFSMCNKAQVPTSHQSEGVDTDLVLYVMCRPTLGGVLAYASHCALETQGRPVAGTINFGPASLSFSVEDYPSLLGVAIHEITHVLGFSRTFFGAGSTNSMFRDSAGQILPSSSVLTTRSIAGYTAPVTLVHTPSVVAWVRAYYGCSTLAGAELEGGGGAGTALSHWEKRLFHNEYMTGSASNAPVFSSLTLALLNDTGFYRVNVSAAQPLTFGRNTGCDFPTQRCNKWPSEYLCETGDDYTPVCVEDHTVRGYCQVPTFSTALPTDYQYFSDPWRGGVDPLADHCPTPSPYANGLCPNSSRASDSTPAARGQNYADYSRCLTTTLQSPSTPSPSPALNTTGCYGVACASAQDLRVRVDRFWYRCPSSGALAVRGYDGSVYCSAAALCAGVDTDPHWPVLAAVRPTAGVVGQPLTLNITGCGFVPVSAVFVGQTPCDEIQSVNSTFLVCVVSALSADDAGMEVRVTVVLDDSLSRMTEENTLFSVKAKNNIFDDIWGRLSPFLLSYYFPILIFAMVVSTVIAYKCKARHADQYLVRLRVAPVSPEVAEAWTGPTPPPAAATRPAPLSRKSS